MKNVRMLSLLAVMLLALSSFTTNPAADWQDQADQLAAEKFPIGGAYLVFAEKFGGEVTKKQLEGQCELGVDGCARGSRIFSYTLEITHAGKTSTYTAKSNALTTEMLAGLKALKAGDSFEFKKTKAYLPNGKDEVDVHSRKFVVV